MSSSADSEMPSETSAPPEREAEILGRALAFVQRLLPAGWSLQQEDPPAGPDMGVDRVGVLRGPDGSASTLLIQVKRLVNTRDVRNLLWDLDKMRGYPWPADATPMLVARYLAPETRKRISDAGAAYADATGNLSIALDQPPMFLRDAGADRDPWRGPGRPRETFRGAPAARVIRALADFKEALTVPELAKRAGASTGATYRVVELAEQEGLLTRKPRQPMSDVHWRALLERWSRDYGVQSNNVTAAVLAPRGLDDLLARLRTMPVDFRYAITGSLAAGRLAPYAPARTATIYVDGVDVINEAMRPLDLRRVDRGANVILASGEYDVVFDRLDEDDGLRYAAPSQVAVDLLTGAGRNPSEGQALLNWMEANEAAWRR